MKKILYIVLVITLATIFFLLTPQTSKNISAYQESDGHLLLPQKNVVIVTIDLNENSYDLTNLKHLNTIKALNETFKAIPGVNRVDSLFNSTVISSNSDDIEVKPFLSESTTQEELKTQIKNVYQYPELMPYINKNGNALLFYIYFGYSVPAATILNSLENIEANISTSFSYTGKSPIIAVTERLLSKDIVIFIPLLFIVIMVIFLSFRSWKAIGAAWLIIVLSVSLSFSMIKYIGIELTPLVLLVPVFALGLLSDYIIHYIYHLFYAPHGGNSFKIRKSLLYPLGLTALSTLMGFISLIYINASGHILLGSIIAISVLTTFIGVILWLPYLTFKKPNKELLPRFSHYQTILFHKLYDYKKILFILLFIGVLWGISKLPNLQIEPYPIEQLPETSTVRKAEDVINKEFFGSLPFLIEIDGGGPNSFLNKETLKNLDHIHEILNQSEEVGYSYSLLTVLKRINYYFMGDEESLLTSTDYDDYYAALIEQYLLYYSSGVDPLEYESMVDPSFRFFAIKGYIKYENVESLNAFFKSIEDINDQIPDNWTLGIHGVVSDLEEEKDGLTINWIFSFAIGSFLIFITVLLFYRKIKLALLSLIPGFISMILSFGIISSMGVKIDSFSIIFVAIITGLVIDYSIHTLSALDNINDTNSISEGFSYINSYSGIPIFLSFLTSLFSFSVLFLSSFNGARNLGILLFASLIISYILSLYLLPIIILPTKLKRGDKK